ETRARTVRVVGAVALLDEAVHVVVAASQDVHVGREADGTRTGQAGRLVDGRGRGGRDAEGRDRDVVGRARRPDLDDRVHEAALVLGDAGAGRARAVA